MAKNDPEEFDVRLAAAKERLWVWGFPTGAPDPDDERTENHEDV